MNIKNMTKIGHIDHMRETINAHKISVRQSKYKIQILRAKLKLYEILKMYVVRLWAGFRGGHICNMVMNLLVP
jgi:hypothetical protein